MSRVSAFPVVAMLGHTSTPANSMTISAIGISAIGHCNALCAVRLPCIKSSASNIHTVRPTSAKVRTGIMISKFIS